MTSLNIGNCTKNGSQSNENGDLTKSFLLYKENKTISCGFTLDEPLVLRPADVAGTPTVGPSRMRLFQCGGFASYGVIPMIFHFVELQDHLKLCSGLSHCMGASLPVLFIARCWELHRIEACLGFGTTCEQLLHSSNGGRFGSSALDGTCT